MGLVHENQFPQLILEEVATDGSDTPNPAADHRTLFLGEDGLLHLRDSGGSISDVGGGGGSVATDAIFDAKGDLAVGTGANTAAKLTAGTDGYLLAADSSQATGLKWVVAPAAPTAVYKSSDQTSTSNVLADVTDMGFSVLANKDYLFEYHILWQATATTTGVLFSVNGPASPTDLAFTVMMPQTASTEVWGHQRAYDAGQQTASIDTANDTNYGFLRGILRNGSNAGTLILRFRCEGTSQQVDLKQGSYGLIYLLN